MGTIKIYKDGIHKISMKKIGVILISLLLLNIICFSLIRAENIPGMPISESDLNKVENLTNKIPLDEQGNVDESKVTEWKSQAELRIEQINKYIGPVSKFLFGVELSLSWMFVFSVLLWITIALLITSPIKDILNLNTLLAFLIGIIIATIGMNTLGPKLISMISLALNTWWAAVIAIVLIVIILAVYIGIMKTFGDNLRAKNKQDEEALREQKAETVEKINDIRLKGEGI